MTTIKEIRARRRAADIAAAMLSAKAGIQRTRYSAFECGHLVPNQDELERLEVALDRLVEARVAIQETASRVGWPSSRAACI
jgi:ribosome-binding protein aMBF1 (putative translation factor)